jgi:hypothetical protein
MAIALGLKYHGFSFLRHDRRTRSNIRSRSALAGMEMVSE